MKQILSFSEYNDSFAPLREQYDYSPQDTVLPVIPTLQVFYGDPYKEGPTVELCMKIAKSALLEISQLLLAKPNLQKLPEFLDSNDFFWFPEQEEVRIPGYQWLKVKAREHKVMGYLNTNNPLFIHHTYFLPPETIVRPDTFELNIDSLEKTGVSQILFTKLCSNALPLGMKVNLLFKEPNHIYPRPTPVPALMQISGLFQNNRYLKILQIGLQ